MAGIPKDSGQDIRPQCDKSLRFLLIAFGITASIAASVIVIAYTTLGAQPSDGTETSGVTKSDKTEKIDRAANLPSDTQKEPEKSVNDFTGYIDRLLSNADNDQEISEQASDRPTTSDADDKPSEPAEIQRSKPADEPSSEPADEPSSEPADEPSGQKSIVQDVLEQLGELT